MENKLIEEYKTKLKAKIKILNDIDKERAEILSTFEKLGDIKLQELEPYMKSNLQKYDILYEEIKKINKEIEKLINSNS